MCLRTTIDCSFQSISTQKCFNSYVIKSSSRLSVADIYYSASFWLVVNGRGASVHYQNHIWGTYEWHDSSQKSAGWNDSSDRRKLDWQPDQQRTERVVCNGLKRENLSCVRQGYIAIRKCEKNTLFSEIKKGYSFETASFCFLRRGRDSNRVNNKLIFKCLYSVVVKCIRICNLRPYYFITSFPIQTIVYAFDSTTIDLCLQLFP